MSTASPPAAPTPLSRPLLNARKPTWLEVAAVVLWLSALVAAFVWELDRFKSMRLPVKLPWTPDEATALLRQLRQVQASDPQLVMLFYCTIYLIKQTFCVPGSGLLNLLGGALFGLPRGLLLVAALSTAGSTSCYFAAWTLAGGALRAVFPTRLERLSAAVAAASRSRQSLFLYMLSARVFPLSPQWFLNIAAPLVGIPAAPFAAAYAVGLLAYNFLTVEAGSLLESALAVGTGALLSPAAMLQLAALALVPLLLPALLRRLGLEAPTDAEKKTN